MKFQVLENKYYKQLKSENYNYLFSKENGYMMQWGKTKEEDPGRAPAPVLADIEVVASCKGPGGKICPFCVLPGEKINVPNKGLINIENIKPGDIVSSVHEYGGKIYPNDNIVEEVYSHYYEGDIIEIELMNGEIIKVTENHPIMVKNEKGKLIEKNAGDLTLEDEIIHIDDFIKCERCGNPIAKRNQNQTICHQCRKELQNHKICLRCGDIFQGKNKRSRYCKNCLDSGEENSKHPLIQTWLSMFDRCYNPKNPSYKHYGGKIKVCDSWTKFENFINDMGSKPDQNYELDRINNNKDYSPENCRWVTKELQSFNRRQPKNSKHPYKGISQTPSGKWKCEVPTGKGKRKYLGVFNSIEEAIKVREKYINEIYLKEIK